MQRCSGVRPLASCAFGLAPYSTFRKVSVAKSKVPSIPTSRLPHPIAAAGFACDLRWQHSAVLSSTARVNCRSSTAQLSCRRGVSEERCARETTGRSGRPTCIPQRICARRIRYPQSDDLLHLFNVILFDSTNQRRVGKMGTSVGHGAPRQQRVARARFCQHTHCRPLRENTEQACESCRSETLCLVCHYRCRPPCHCIGQSPAASCPPAACAHLEIAWDCVVLA